MVPALPAWMPIDIKPVPVIIGTLVTGTNVVLIGLNNVYEDLCDFVYDVVFESYDEKLGYAYRFEAPVEKIDGTQRGVTTEEDYNIVLNKIHEILEPYFR